MKIAVIGGGISGLGAAWLLQQRHSVTLYEQDARLGGHSRTVFVNTIDGQVAIDTGFIVFNDRTYPHLCGLFQVLDVPTAESDMSFGVSQSGYEYSTKSLMSLFAQPANLLRPRHYKMLLDVLRFFREAKHHLEHASETPNLTLGAFLKQINLGEAAQRDFVLAMGAAIWSCSLQQVSDTPAQSFLRFFENHGLLTVTDQPQWRTVIGGSREYVRRIAADLHGAIKTGCGVKSVIRDMQTQQDAKQPAAHIRVTCADGSEASYDHVVFACHADQALACLATPTAEERRLLGAIRSQPNRIVLHTDRSFMPKRRRAWASWVYLSGAASRFQGDVKDSYAQPPNQAPNQAAVSLTYWMNALQPLPTRQNIFVTVNPGHDPKEIINETVLRHPVFDAAAIQAQSMLDTLQNISVSTSYAGAWTRYGFHEDGLLSAVKVAQRLGCTPPWTYA